MHTDISPSGQNKLMIYVNSSRRILFACNIASGGSRGGTWEGQAPPLFLDQTEAQRAEKNCFGDQTRPPYLWVLMTGPALPEGLDLPLIATSYIKTSTIK